MPVHDWTRVGPEMFHDFQLAWNVHLAEALNSEILPDSHYATIEQSSVDELPHRGNRIEASEACVTLRRSTVIRHASNEQIVARVEIVSPGNKQSWMKLDDFLRKAASAIKSGCHLLIIDLFPHGKHDPSGIHGAFWEYIEGSGFELPANRPLTLVAYSAGPKLTAYVEPTAVGNELPQMPLFLDSTHYVNTPLEETYQQSWAGFPSRWKRLVVSEES